MEFICPICKSGNNKELFSKESSSGETFNLYRCPGGCGLEIILPIPSPEVLNECYQGSYFSKRTDRGYDNYFSDKVRFEIERVFTLNLADLNFFDYESALPDKRFSLDIGCAAGYFVSYMQSRGWSSSGIEISVPCADFAKNKLKLNVINGDYLSAKFPYRFDLITMWATIEHLPDPESFIKKIASDLNPGGMLIISSCRADRISFKSFFGKKWRFYNFPEHIFFFTERSLKTLLSSYGFKAVKAVRYGSGVGKSGTFSKKIADFLAKYLHLGDMMALCFIKEAVTAEVKECSQLDQLTRLEVVSEE